MSKNGLEQRGEAAIVGAATFGCGEAPGWTSVELAAKAALAALADAGRALHEVDGLFACLPDDVFAPITLSEYLGLRPRLTDGNRTGGSAFATHVIHAARALVAGSCNVALILYGSNQRSAAKSLVTLRGPSTYERPYRPVMPVTAYALAAARHMHVYGTTREQLARVAVSARLWAQHNPEAFARGPLSIEDCLSARMIATPLGARDCCLVTDGAAAIIMTRRADAGGSGKRATYLLGGAAETSHDMIAQMPDLTRTAAVESGRRALSQAGVRPADIDLVQLYDAFTINTVLFLENLGFCKPGEGGPLVASGAIDPGGALPVNTNGGGLSCVHPGMYGLFAIVEAHRQLCGTAPGLQTANPHLALVHTNGLTLSSQVTLVLGTAETL